MQQLPIETTVHRLLRMLRIRVSHDLLKRKLLSHPEPNSLLSITDTLDSLGIPNSAIRVGRDDLSQLEPPYLVHLRRNSGEFALVTVRGEVDNSYAGIVLVAEKPVAVTNTE